MSLQTTALSEALTAPFALPRDRAPCWQAKTPCFAKPSALWLPHVRQTSLKKSVLCWLLISMLLFCLAWPAFAGTTGDELRPAAEKLAGLIGGWGGKTICLCALVLGIIGSALKFNPYAVAGCFGTCLVAGVGVGIVNASVTALI